MLGIGNGPGAIPPNVKGSASLTISSGTLKVNRTTNGGSEAFMANRADSTLLINGGNFDLSGHLNNFRLIQEGFPGMTSTITISSGTMTCAFLDLYYDTPNEPLEERTGTGIINLEGTGVLALNRFGLTSPAPETLSGYPRPTSFEINLNGGTLRCRNANTNFLPALIDTRVVVKSGGGKIDTNGFNSTIAAVLEHDDSLGATPDGGITKIGEGMLTLAGDNTYNGGFTNDGGSVRPNGDTALGTGPVVSNTGNVYPTETTVFNNTLTLNNSTLRIGGANNKTVTWNGPVTATGTSGIGADGGTAGITLGSTLNIAGATFSSGGSTNNIDGDISGAGGTLNINNGTLQLSGTNTYTGTTTLSGSAVLSLQPTGTLSNSSNVVINGNGNFNIRNTVGWVYTGEISGDGTGSINPNSGSDATLAGNISGVTGITANNTDTDTTVSGNITGPVNVTVQGGAILNLSGNNSAMTGTVTLSGTAAGTLLNIENSTALGTGTLVFGGGPDGSIDNTSGAPITLSSNNPQAWNQDVRFVGTNDLNLGSGAVTLGGTRDVTVAAGTLTVGGVIAGGEVGAPNEFAALRKYGLGNLVLTGENLYKGETTVFFGALLVNSPGSLAEDGVVTVDTFGTLGGNGTISGDVIVSAGGKVAPGASAGTLSIGGGLDVSAMAAANGTLNFELDALAAASDAIAVGGTLTIGDGALGFDDFNFTNLGGLEEGTYTLITSGGITGSLDLESNLGGAIGAFNGEIAVSDNSIVLIVTPGTGGFAAWQAANSTAGALGDDHDNDGVSNGVEFFLRGAIDTSGFDALPGVMPDDAGLSVTWTKAASGYSGTYGAGFVVETSESLIGEWTTEIVAPDPGFTVTVTGNDVKYEFPTGTKKFARLKVTGP